MGRSEARVPHQQEAAPGAPAPAPAKREGWFSATQYSQGRPWQKGQSGNPAGRPKGIIDKRRRLAQAIGDDKLNAVIQRLLTEALGGDVQAIRTIIDRVEPALKPAGELVRFQLDTSLDVTEQARQVVQAIADGHITSEQALLVMQCIGALANIATAQTHEERIAALEGKATAGRVSGAGAALRLVPMDKDGKLQTP